MELKIEKYKLEIEKIVLKNNDDLEKFRIRFIGKNGIIKKLFLELKNASDQEKRKIGKPINELKNLVNNKIIAEKERLENQIKENNLDLDLTLDSPPFVLGAKHPVSIVRKEIIDIFRKMGFETTEGDEIVNDWFNFTALNVPKDHPARDMQDTFFVKKNPDIVLRTHTTSVQAKVLSKQEPPVRLIATGRVYRNETISAKSHMQFHQLEGVFLDRDVSFADLKQVLFSFVKEFFGDDTKIRFRPSFFPFTEPSAEMDIGSTKIMQKKGENKLKWLEIMGCGMIDPKVLEYANIDNQKYSGFAFGMGIERMAMIKYHIKDIRMLYDNDIKFLNQFRTQI